MHLCFHKKFPLSLVVFKGGLISEIFSLLLKSPCQITPLSIFSSGGLCSGEWHLFWKIEPKLEIFLRLSYLYQNIRQVKKQVLKLYFVGQEFVMFLRTFSVLSCGKVEFFFPSGKIFFQVQNITGTMKF